jgi:hypothetical protein
MKTTQQRQRCEYVMRNNNQCSYYASSNASSNTDSNGRYCRRHNKKIGTPKCSFVKRNGKQCDEYARPDMDGLCRQHYQRVNAPKCAYVLKNGNRCKLARTHDSAMCHRHSMATPIRMLALEVSQDGRLVKVCANPRYNVADMLDILSDYYIRRHAPQPAYQAPSEPREIDEDCVSDTETVYDTEAPMTAEI